MIKQIRNILKGKFAKDTIWLTVSQVILILSGLLLNIVIDLGYGTETLGIFNQALGFYMILSSVFALGINSSIIHHMSGESNMMNKSLLSAAITVSFISTMLLTLTALYLAFSYPSLFSSAEVQKGLLILLFAIPIFNINKNLMALLTAGRKQKDFSLFRSIRWLLLIGLIAFFTFGVKWQEGLYFSFLFTEFTLFLILLSRTINAFTRTVKLKQMKLHFSFGTKSFISEVLSVLTRRLDVVIIGYFLTQWEVGVFSFYIFFVKSLLIFPGILQQNINPLIAKHWKEKTLGKLDKKLKKMRRINTVFSIIQLFLILIFYSFYTYFFRPDYINSILFLSINCLAILPLTQIAWGGGILIMTGMLRANIIRSALMAIFSILTLIFCSYFFGLIGSCVAVSLNMLFTFYIVKDFVHRKVGIRLI